MHTAGHVYSHDDVKITDENNTNRGHNVRKHYQTWRTRFYAESTVIYKYNC